MTARCPTCGQKLLTRGEWAAMLRSMAKTAEPDMAQKLLEQAAIFDVEPETPLNQEPRP